LNIEQFIAKRLNKKNTKKQYSKSITKLCILSISSCLAIIIISICTGRGLEKEIKKNLSSINSSITIENYYNLNSENFIKNKYISIEDSTLKEIQNIGNVKSINKVISTFAILSNKNDFVGIILNGLKGSSQKKYLNDKIISGRKPINKFEILISKFQSDKLGLNLNDTILSSFLRKNKYEYNDTHSKLTVCGIYQTEIENFDKNLCFTNYEYLRKKLKLNDKVSYYQVFLKDINKFKEVNYVINNKIHDIKNNYEIKSFSINEKYPNIFNWISLFKKNIILITIIMLTVCLINISIFLIVMVVERSQMIGVLKSFGGSNFQIVKIFFYRSINIVFKGLFFGNFFGFLVCTAQKKFKIIKLNPESYFVNEIPIYFDFYSIFLSNLLIFVLIPIAIIIPYIKISKLTISNSLKIK
tara:strand:+ start:6078 stop:7319 length:1242 start_codon:yes stop_codon:yes gene_type:complete